MGGSLGLSLKAHGLPWHVAGFTRNAARGRRALKRGAVDSLHRTAAEAVQDADLVVLCGPVLALPQQARDCRPGLKPGAVVTDVGSTKAVADQAVRASLRGSGAWFVGSHPVCGSEQQGIESARADLYDGALVIVTTTVDAPRKAVQLVRGLWQQAGARVVACGAGEHDRIMARTSHLPHMVASQSWGFIAAAGLRIPRGWRKGRRKSGTILSRPTAPTWPESYARIKNRRNA